MNFNTIPEALEDLRQGKIILVTDDPDRENEGDFICAAEFATTENINFMATHGKGLICMPMSEAFVRKLQFPQIPETSKYLPARYIHRCDSEFFPMPAQAATPDKSPARQTSFHIRLCSVLHWSRWFTSASVKDAVFAAAK